MPTLKEHLLADGFNPEGVTPEDVLIYSAQDKISLDTFKQSVMEATNLNIHDKEGNTALMHASNNENCEEKATLLIEAGANLDMRNKGGNTAIMHAIFASVPTTKKLVEAGADLNIRNNRGEIALHLILNWTDKGITCSKRADIVKKAMLKPVLKSARGLFFANKFMNDEKRLPVDILNDLFGFMLDKTLAEEINATDVVKCYNNPKRIVLRR